MLLIDARRNARVDDAGAFVRLAEQDRSRWDRARIEEGQEMLRRASHAITPAPINCRRRSMPCTATRAAHRKPTGNR
jgi:predicted RNA polymerase sigma factor